MSYRRFVALGDSTTEGLVDPNPDGSFRGWADRLAERLAEDEPGLLYANLAVRGKLAGQVRADQLEPALALEPDLASVLCGLNDLLRRSVDVPAVAVQLETMVSALRDAGADVITVTFPDPVPVNPLASRAATRVRRLNALIREISEAYGAKLVDLEAHPVSSDRRLWDVDRLHANPEGHRRIALAAAEALGLEVADPNWTVAYDDPLGPRSPVEHAVWAWKYLRPWLIRRLRGRSSGDGIQPKRPTLEPIRATAYR
ncbi:MAG TPA: SGNH/GDSL hydrolase family protein [Solirubrobacter sp.]|jgi:lysophospholipase L1-like esterase|nr:SGNH/GDSL hydrolase family protein [Solirubrobacter sp.]